MNTPTPSPPNKQLARGQRRLGLQTFRHALAAFVCAAGLFPGVGVLVAKQAYDSCSSPEVYVEYKVARTNLNKLGFPEFTHPDWPRIHVYHKQVTHELFDVYSSTGGSSDTNSSCTVDCGGGGSRTFALGPGSWTNCFNEAVNVTNTEWRLGPFATYSNIIGGTWGLNILGEDTRSWSGTRCDDLPRDRTYWYDFRDLPTLAQVYEYEGYPRWCWAGEDHTISKSSGSHSYENYTNDMTVEFAMPLDVPDFVGELTERTQTHERYELDPAPYFPYTASGSYTINLSEEYTDAELRTNILNLMPQYPQDWFTPSGNTYDLYQTIAYSVIDGDHTNGNYWWRYCSAELQKMKYHFAIPNSEADVTYRVTWDVITWHTPYGGVTTDHKSCLVAGTGNPVAAACSDDQEAMPPDWDGGSSDEGGWVVRWIDHVRVSVLPDRPSGPGGPPGSGGPLPPGGARGACSTCSGGAGPFQSQNEDWPGFAAEFSMGQSLGGTTAGSLTTYAETPDSHLVSPAALSYLGSSPWVEVISISDQIRQVSAPQALADIVTISDSAYEIRYYLPEQVGNKVNGVYEVSGSPFVTWKIENPSSGIGAVRVTETRGSDARIYNYTYTPGSWKLDYPGGARQDECTVSITESGTAVILGELLPYWLSTGLPGYKRTVTATTRVPGGADQFQVRRVYQRFAWGEPLVEETLAPYTSPQTTAYVYDEYQAAGRRGQLLRKAIHYDGSWEWFTYDTVGHFASVYSAQGNIPPDGDTPPANARLTEYYYDCSQVSSSGDDGTLQLDAPRYIVESQGEPAYTVSAHFTAFPSAGMRIDVQNLSVGYNMAWDAPGSLFTTNRYSGSDQNWPISVVRPDGTLQTFGYGLGMLYRTNMTALGQPDATFTHVIDGTTNVTILNLANCPVLSITRDVATGVVLSQETYSNFDSFGRPQRVTHLDGTYEDTYYDCCGVSSTIDRDGVATQYWYDSMKRQTASTRLAITVTNVLDAPGRVVKTTRIGSDGTPLTQRQFQYNLAGQAIAETNALGGGTTHVQTINGSGALVRTDTYPDGGTRVETYYRDGTVQSITGSAVHPVRYEYGVDLGNTGDWDDLYHHYIVEIKLNTNGSDSSEWTRIYMDAAGRAYKAIYADSTPGSLSDNPYAKLWYNSLGQPWKAIDPDGVITLRTYNAKGEPEYTLTALSDTARGLTDYDTLIASLDGLKADTDRITRTVRSVIPSGSGRPDSVRTDTYAWMDGQSTGTLVSRSEISAAGLDSWQTVYRDVNTPVVTHSQTAYGGGGARTATTIAPDNSYVTSAYSNGRLISVTRKNSSNQQLSAVTYAYDPHGRPSSATDARNGATTYGYNAADLITSVTTPNPGPGSGPQTTLAYYNNLLQTTSVVNPDGASVAMEYYLTGELRREYGSRTYPVAFSFDYAGRLKTMTNWSNFATGAGARVTTWNYNPARGWLASKQYADGQGPSYAYTGAGRLQTRTWARTVGGQAVTTTCGFDSAGGVSNVSYSDSTPGITCTHDRLGRLASVVQNGMTVTNVYNAANELLSESFSGGTLGGLSVTNGYDEYLRRTELGAQSSSTTLLHHSFGYDAGSRLQTVTDNTGSPAYSATYSYLANSPLVSQITFKQGTTTRMTTAKQYDFLNRLTSISSAIGSLAVGDSYAYNNANQRTRSTLADGSYWLDQYDSLGQVTSGRKYWSDQTPVAGQQFEYTFDTIGNRTQTKAGGDQNGANLRLASYSANLLNQYTNRDVPGTVDIMGLSFATNTVTVNNQTAYRKGEYFRAEVSVNNGSTSVWQSVTVAATNQTSVSGNVFVPKTQEQFRYDADGNLTNDGRWAYTWDAENRLVAMTNNTSVGPPQGLKFEYDWRGRRIHKQVWSQGSAPTNDVKFVYAGWNLLAELNATNNAVIRSCLWGSDLSGSIQGAGGVGGLLGVIYAGAQTTNCFVAFDGNGNVAALADAASTNILAQYEFGPFGELLRATGPMAKANPLRFSSKYQDDETDLLYYNYRYYNSSTGRWLSRDPVAEYGGPILYGFVGNNPISNVDPLGLEFGYWYGDDSTLSYPSGNVPYLTGETWWENLASAVYDAVPFLNNSVGRLFKPIDAAIAGLGDAATQASRDPAVGQGVKNLLTAATILLPIKCSAGKTVAVGETALPSSNPVREAYKALGIETTSSSTAPSRVYAIYQQDGQLFKFGVTDAHFVRMNQLLEMAGPGSYARYTDVIPKYQAHLGEKYLRSLQYSSTGIWPLPGMKVPYPVDFTTKLPIPPQ